MLHELLKHRALLVIGKGGVGRTTAAAALAAHAARRGMRTLVMEPDLRKPIAASYGKRSGYEPVELEANLWAMELGGQESLEEYLGFVVPRPVLRVVFASTLYQYFVAAAPALRELTMMGKLYHEIERRAPRKPPWDLLIFDAPASGQALSMIRMPFAAHATFGDSVVGREARQVARFLREKDKCAVIQVTSAEPLPMAETLETHLALRTLGLDTAAIVFNRATPATFETGDVARLMRRCAHIGGFENTACLAEIAQRGLNQRARERRASAILERRIGCPLIELKDYRGLSRLGLTEVLAAQLARDEADAEPRADVTQLKSRRAPG